MEKVKVKLTNFQVTLDLLVDEREVGHPNEWDWKLLLDLNPLEELREVRVVNLGKVVKDVEDDI